MTILRSHHYALRNDEMTREQQIDYWLRQAEAGLITHDEYRRKVLQLDGKLYR